MSKLQGASDLPLRPLWVRILFWTALLFIFCGLLWIGPRYGDVIARTNWITWITWGARLSPVLVASPLKNGSSAFRNSVMVSSNAWAWPRLSAGRGPG